MAVTPIVSSRSCGLAADHTAAAKGPFPFGIVRCPERNSRSSIGERDLVGASRTAGSGLRSVAARLGRCRRTNYHGSGCPCRCSGRGRSPRPRPIAIEWGDFKWDWKRTSSPLREGGLTASPAAHMVESCLALCPDGGADVRIKSNSRHALQCSAHTPSIRHRRQRGIPASQDQRQRHDLFHCGP